MREKVINIFRPVSYWHNFQPITSWENWNALPETWGRNMESLAPRFRTVETKEIKIGEPLLLPRQPAQPLPDFLLMETSHQLTDKFALELLSSDGLVLQKVELGPKSGRWLLPLGSLSQFWSSRMVSIRISAPLSQGEKSKFTWLRLVD